MEREIKIYYPSLKKHNITEKEVIEALKAENYYNKRIGKRIAPRYLLIAESFEGKIIELIYRLEPDGSMFIFHAMKATKENKNLYLKRRKR